MITTRSISGKDRIICSIGDSNHSTGIPNSRAFSKGRLWLADGINSGAILTAAKDMGLIYLNKGILYGTTSVGSFIYPGPGTVVGFVVGGVACVIVDIFVSDYLDDLIDRVVE